MPLQGRVPCHLQSPHIAKAHARITTANALDKARRQADDGGYAAARQTIEQALVTAKAAGASCGADDPLVENLVEQLSECASLTTINLNRCIKVS